METVEPDRKHLLDLVDAAWVAFCASTTTTRSQASLPQTHSLQGLFMQQLLAAIEDGSGDQHLSDACLALRDYLLPFLQAADPCPALLTLGQIHEHLHSQPLAASMPSGSKASPASRTGRVYTPLWLVREMLAELLAGWQLAPAAELADMQLPRLLDPACGCGAFLLVAASEVHSRLLAALPQHPADQHVQADPALRRRIVERVLHGCDTDAPALELCSALLRYWACGCFHDDSLRLQLRHADALSGPAPGQPASLATEPVGLDWTADAILGIGDAAFDYVIGNPPYIDSEAMIRNTKQFREYARRNYRTARGNWDLYVLFFERGLSLLNANGRLSLVVPARSICADYASALQHMLLEHGLARIRLLDQDVFPAARIWPVIIQTRCAGSTRTGEPIRLQLGTAPSETLVSPQLLQRLPAGYLAAAFSEGAEFIAALLEENPPLGQLMSCSDGCSTAEAYRLADLIGDDKPGDGFKLINTGTLDPYTSLWGKRKCRYLGQSYLQPRMDRQSLADLLPQRAKQAGSPKLLVAGLSSRIECFADSAGDYICGKAAVQLIPKDDALDLDFICGLLNSSLLNWLYRSLFGLRGYSARALNIGPRQLELLPIAVATEQQAFTSLARQLSRATCGRALQDPRYLQLDEMVYELYGVDPAMRAIVERELRN